MITRRAVVAAAIVDNVRLPTRLLAARRTEPPDLAGGWELPGGKVDPGENDVEALHREIREELGIAIKLGPAVPGPLTEPDTHRWPLGERYAVAVWLAQPLPGEEPRPIEAHDELRWLAFDDPFEVAWLPSNRTIVEQIGRSFG